MGPKWNHECPYEGETEGDVATEARGMSAVTQGHVPGNWGGSRCWKGKEIISPLKPPEHSLANPLTLDFQLPKPLRAVSAVYSPKFVVIFCSSQRRQMQAGKRQTHTYFFMLKFTLSTKASRCMAIRNVTQSVGV